jgi:small subunit ribosomal protein S16
VAVKIKLKRMGKIRAPYYRIIVADARTKRDGRAIEEIGKYHPKEEPSLIEVDSERAQHWLSVGAQPTDPVRKLLEVTGDWQKFKGLPGAEGTLRTAAAKTDKKEAFAAAVAETLKDTGLEAKGKGGGRKPAANAKAEAKNEAEARDGSGKGRSGSGRSGSARARAEGKAEAKGDAEAKDADAKGEAAGTADAAAEQESGA